MKKKSLLFAFAALLLWRTTTAQLTPTITATDVTNAQTSINASIASLATNQLVTDYTFRRVFADEFAKILSVDNFSSSTIKSASVKIDEDKSTFAFSPFIYHWGDQQKGEPLHGYLNISLKGEVNSDEVATVFNSSGFNRNFELGFNFNFLLPSSNSGHDLTAAQMTQFRTDQLAIATNTAAYYNGLLPTPQPLDFIENKDALTNVAKLQQAFRKKFSEAEEKVAEDHWTSSSKYWIGVSANLGYTTQSGLNIISKETKGLGYFNPSGMLSFSSYREWIHSNISLFGTLYMKGSTKNSFTGKDPVSWNSIEQLSDSTFVIKEQKDVYNYNPDTYKKEFLPTLGAQGIIMFDGKIGFDLSYKYDWLVKTEAEEKRARKLTQTYGIVFPLNDKDGERTINIELFYSNDSYNTPTLETNDFLGIKFSIPIFSR